MKVNLHCENYSSGQQQPGKARRGAGPKGKEPFLFVYDPRTSKAIAVVRPSVDRLHPGFNRILSNEHIVRIRSYKWHRCVSGNQSAQYLFVHSDESSSGTYAKCAQRT